MKLTKNAPLTEREIDWLEAVLLKYGNDDSMLCFSELDGFLTAIVSGPNMIPPSTWLSALWGRGDSPSLDLRKRDDALCGAVFSTHE